MRVVAPRDGRVQTLVGGRGSSVPLTDGPLRLFEPKKDAKKGPTQKTTPSSSSISSSSSNSVNSTDKSAQNKAASKKADQNDEGSTNGKPLWKKGDVLEGVAWQRGGGLWQQAVVLEAWGAAFGDQTPRAHVGNNAAATAKARATGGGGASLSGSTEGSAANSLTAQALTPLNPAVVYIKH